MPRATDGTYTLAPLNPVVRGDPIVIDWANPTMDDIEAALTDSLSRSGKGPMLAPLTLLNSTPANALHATSKGYVDARPPGEAPVDGKQYSRKNSAWIEVTPFPEAPINGLQYARKDAAWAQVTPFPEAPVDGQQYARKDAAWSIVAASTAGSAGEWTFNTTLTAPPSSGQIRLNTADQTVATTLYISDLTAPGSDLGNYLTRSLVAKSRLYIQDKDDSSKYQFYRLQADSVAGAGYHSVAISWLSGGGALSAQRVLMSILPQASTEFGSLAYNNFTVDDTAPAVPKVGDRWVRPATGDEMVRIPTGDGAGAWIDPGASQIPLPLAIASGGTAGTTAVQAKTNLGLGNVDNTSDANKPVSTATATALAGKQASLGFTPVQQGGGIGQLTNTVKIGWAAGSQLKATVDTTDLGNLLFGNQFVASLGNVGYQKFPTGLIIQWGTSVVTTDAGGAAAISYPIAFPNAIFVAVVANGDHAQGNLLIQSFSTGWPTTAGHAIYVRIANTGAAVVNTTVRINWVAFGN